MKLDTFYVVTIPEHTKKEISFNGICIGIEPKETKV